MSRQNELYLSRRAFLWKFLSLPAAVVLAACGAGVATETVSESAAAESTAVSLTNTLAPTPACGDDDDNLTPAQTEGPYFTPDSPERTSLLEPGITGTTMLLTGYVLTTGCQPVARALVDFWHADDAGVYDNVGYKLRGHQFTDGQGRYSLETIVPGLYPGRTRHFHVKVQAPDQPVLTTQLYFPDEAANESDGIYNPDLRMTVAQTAGAVEAAFNFVLAQA